MRSTYFRRHFHSAASQPSGSPRTACSPGPASLSGSRPPAGQSAPSQAAPRPARGGGEPGAAGAGCSPAGSERAPTSLAATRREKEERTGFGASSKARAYVEAEQWRATGSREGSQCRVAGRVHLRTLRRLTPAQPEGGAPQPRAGGTDLPPGPGTEGSARARAPRGKLRLAATLRVRGRGGNTAPRARVCVRGCGRAARTGGNTPRGGRDGSFRTAPDSDPPARAGSLAPKAQLAVRGQDSSDTRRQGTEREA